LNETTEEGYDPLDLAVANGHFECVQVLVEVGHLVRRKHVNAAHESGKAVIFNFLKRMYDERMKNEGGVGFQVSYITRESLYDSMRNVGGKI
jgi:hypothetical protein